ncbi:secondary thiamine-phosphate synthase enzyme YjbQ [Candidatus Nitrospira neomarina]|uniref:Secondary thiamine-phosphate synthase enzyme YjbQ n=1 Tax=Candidatus Nitrospira neomarina TaxID=3020899 RepID=A0AA96GHB4_9BACT|nr:secondary thiamine-phosphate synthase enzyme YjbQ [Candidatus Nitrospira neomarina]WNM62364.1 secondary thiamine-phosphate synthase enzyme YjbQ [Candidatus Nitrospira neomarina]
MDTLQVQTKNLKDIVDLTPKLNRIIQNADFQNGLCHVFLPHTTAALTTGEIGEGTEKDLLEVAEKIIPQIRFRHAHDPSHAWSHMAASLIGASLTLPVMDGELRVGTWQSVLLVELDGPRERQLVVGLAPTAGSQ